MTATASEPTTLVTPVPPGTRFRRIGVGLAALAGGLVTMAGFAATVWETEASTTAYLDSLVVDPFRSQVAAVLLSLGYMGLIAVVTALGAMSRVRWAIAGRVGLVLALPGAIVLPGILVVDFYDIAIRQTLPAEQAVAVSDAAAALPLAPLMGGVFIPLMCLGLVVLAVVAQRNRFLQAVAVLPMIVAFFTISDSPGPVFGWITGATFLILMAAVGIAALRMTDEEWVGGSRGAGR